MKSSSHLQRVKRFPFGLFVFLNCAFVIIYWATEPPAVQPPTARLSGETSEYHTHLSSWARSSGSRRRRSSPLQSRLTWLSGSPCSPRWSPSSPSTPSWSLQSPSCGPEGEGVRKSVRCCLTMLELIHKGEKRRERERFLILVKRNQQHFYGLVTTCTRKRLKKGVILASQPASQAQ